jgi:hypothetical protein
MTIKHYRIFGWITSVLLICIFISCKSKMDNNNARSTATIYNDLEDDSDHDDEDEDENFSLTSCGYNDGIYTATIRYYNPDTDYDAIYTLDVEVETCEVTIIYFPKGGWLDDDHIDPAELDEDGYCIIYGEDGKTYEIQID